MNVKTLGNTQAKVLAKVVIDTLADKLPEVQVLTLSETLAEKKAHALVTKLAYHLEVESETTGKTVT